MAEEKYHGSGISRAGDGKCGSKYLRNFPGNKLKDSLCVARKLSTVTRKE
jgi:hypothetical protein